MRPEIKQIKQFSKSLPFSEDYFDKIRTNCNESLENKHADILKSKCIYKLKQPIKIKKGTKWCAKSSSGSISGFFKCDTKLIGITPITHKCLIFDNCCIVSNYDPDTQDPRFEINAAYLSTDILKQICAQL